MMPKLELGNTNHDRKHLAGILDSYYGRSKGCSIGVHSSYKDPTLKFPVVLPTQYDIPLIAYW